MRVGIDARWCFRKAINTQFLLFYNLLLENKKGPYDATFVLYTDNRAVHREEILSGNVVVKELGGAGRSTEGRESDFWRDVWWFHKHMPGVIHDDEIDVFLSPYCRAPNAKGVPVVNMVHDLSFAVLPYEHLPPHLRRWWKRWALLKMTQFYCKYVATHTVTVSKHSRGCIQGLLGLPEGRVSVAYNAIDTQMMERAQLTLAAVVSGQVCPNGYLLFVGYNYPNKNLEKLLAAYRQVPEETKARHPLVLKTTPGSEADLANVPGLDGHVHYLCEHYSKEQLAAIIAGANALVLVSYNEGFGLPVAEAMAAGVPVVISEGGALSEITGGKMTEVDPEEITSIAAGIVRVLNASNSQKGKWISDGKKLARGFEAKRVADSLMDTIRRCGSEMRMGALA